MRAHATIQIADWSRLPDRQMLQSEMKGMLARAIRRAPENYRAVILLRDMEELSTLENRPDLDLTEDGRQDALASRPFGGRQEWMNTCGPIAGCCLRPHVRK